MFGFQLKMRVTLESGGWQMQFAIRDVGATDPQQTSGLSNLSLEKPRCSLPAYCPQLSFVCEEKVTMKHLLQKKKCPGKIPGKKMIVFLA